MAVGENEATELSEMAASVEPDAVFVRSGCCPDPLAPLGYISTYFGGL